MMKRNILVLLLAMLSLGLSAQKAARKAIREGNEAYKEQLYGKSEEEYKKALEVNAGSKEASYNLANTYYKQHKWEEAIGEYQRYLSLEIENPAKMSAAWANMGNTFLRMRSAELSAKGQGQQQLQRQGVDMQMAGGGESLKKSMESYKNALRLNPLDEEVRYNLAVVQKMIKDQEGGGEDKKEEDKQEEKQEQNEDKKEQDKDKKEEKQEENQMSQDNIEQLLKAIEQDERETQERVKQQQAAERKRQNEHNRQQNKDW